MPVPYSPPNAGVYTRTPSQNHSCSAIGAQITSLVHRSLNWHQNCMGPFWIFNPYFWSMSSLMTIFFINFKFMILCLAHFQFIAFFPRFFPRAFCFLLFFLQFFFGIFFHFFFIFVLLVLFPCDWVSIVLLNARANQVEPTLHARAYSTLAQPRKIGNKAFGQDELCVMMMIAFITFKSSKLWLSASGACRLRG